MYQALMIGKEIETGCLEVINSIIADGVQSNPESTIASFQPAAIDNGNPPGYKWVDEEGWLEIEFDKGRNVHDAQNDMNFCADS